MQQTRGVMNSDGGRIITLVHSLVTCTTTALPAQYGGQWCLFLVVALEQQGAICSTAGDIIRSGCTAQHLYFIPCELTYISTKEPGKIDWQLLKNIGQIVFRKWVPVVSEKCFLTVASLWSSTFTVQNDVWMCRVWKKKAVFKFLR